MSDERLILPADVAVPSALDRATHAELTRAVTQAQRHPLWFAAKPVANVALAVGLGVYALSYLTIVFSVVFGH